MKRIICFLLVYLLICCCSTGCKRGNAEPTTPTTAPRVQRPALGPTEDPRATILPTTPYLQIGQGGKQRINYTIPLSNARYITSVDQLPDHPCFAKYDEDFFKANALLIVTETVNSGSVDVAIESVEVEGAVASIRLSHTGNGGIGTGDMAVWLLWAIVDKGLDYEWVVLNPAVTGNTSTT